MNWLAIRIAAVVFAVSGAWLLGHSAGERTVEARQEAARQRLQRDLFAAGERLSEQGAALEAMRADQDRTAREFEDAVRSDVGDDRPGIGVDGLRALDRLWGAP